MRRARGVGGVAALTAVVALLCGAAASACTNLATMSLSAGNGHPGDTITLVGTSFPVPRPTSSAVATPVVVRWKSLDGQVIGTVTPDRIGSISLTFKVPPSDPGNVVILGTQRRPVVNPQDPDAPPTQFIDEPGTPARATFRVLAPGELPPPRNLGSEFAGARGDEGTTAMIVLMVLFGAVALSLFAGGVIAFLHQVRSRKLAAQPWRDW